MRKDYSAPGVMSRPARSTQKGGQQAEEKKRVDYSHLDIIAEAERIIERRLARHTRTSGKYKCQCPFEGCSSLQDAFLVFDRPELEEGQVHFWCNRCGRRGSLIDLLTELKGYTFKEACEDLRIDPHTWRAVGADSEQAEQRRSTASDRRRQERENTRKAEQEEINLLGAWYTRARKWLAVGSITRKDGRQITLDTARLYLQERGFSIEQAALLGLAYIPTAKELPEIAGDQKLAPWRGRILFPLDGPKNAGGYAGRSLWKWAPGMTAEQHKKVLEVDEKNRVPRHYKTRQAAYYGYEEACRASILVIVEGEFDRASVRLALGDLPDIAVCAFGKEFQARLVPVNVLKVILALDGDQAGQEAITRQVDELEGRGVEVEIARPPAGKDWNECHQLAGLDAIRDAIASQIQTSQPKQSTFDRSHAEQGDQIREKPRKIENADAGQQQRIEPPDYESGDICLLCGQKPDFMTEGAFYIVEDKASEFYGDLFCSACWSKQSAPASVEQSELARNSGDQSEMASHRCAKHGQFLRYSDEMGGRYCDHVDCWERYRLIRAGARRGYAALVEVNKKYMHLADTSKEPLYYIDVPGRQERLPVYPNRPPVETMLIAAGADAWRAYVAGRGYQEIDQAVKALASA